MDNFAKIETPAAHCEALLREANRIYLEIGALYQNVMGALSVASLEQVEKTVNVLNGLQKDVHSIDSLIAKNLELNLHPAESTQVLLDMRDDILRQIHGTNRTLVHKAENIKSLVRHELINMTKNRNALKGYKPVETERRSIVRNSF